MVYLANKKLGDQFHMLIDKAAKRGELIKVEGAICKVLSTTRMPHGFSALLEVMHISSVK